MLRLSFVRMCELQLNFIWQKMSLILKDLFYLQVIVRESEVIIRSEESEVLF